MLVLPSGGYSRCSDDVSGVENRRSVSDGYRCAVWGNGGVLDLVGDEQEEDQDLLEAGVLGWCIWNAELRVTFTVATGVARTHRLVKWRLRLAILPCNN
jgi:hypothetical protein